MLSKFEPVVLAVLALGASILMENHHRVDMTQSDQDAGGRPSVIATCQPGARAPRLGVISALAAEGQATLLAFGDPNDVADACAASYLSYSAVRTGLDAMQ